MQRHTQQGGSSCCRWYLVLPWSLSKPQVFLDCHWSFSKGQVKGYELLTNNNNAYILYCFNVLLTAFPLILETSCTYRSEGPGDPFGQGHVGQKQRKNPGLRSLSSKVKVLGRQWAVHPVCSACFLSLFGLPCKLCHLTQKCMWLLGELAEALTSLAFLQQ